MATGREISPKITIHKALSTPNPIMSPTGTHNRSRLKRELDEKMEHLNKKYGLDYYSRSESNSDFKLEHKFDKLI